MIKDGRKINYIQPNWPAPDSIKAYSTTRQLRSGEPDAIYRINGKYQHFNLALHVDDESQHVLNNRQSLIEDLSLPNPPFWLEQVHSTTVLPYKNNSLGSGSRADASYSQKENQVCIVMTADCLPILFCNKQGDWVAATHAGWKGLLNGIIENTVHSYQGSSSDLMAWVGPSIGQQSFEVGKDVQQQFIAVNGQFEKAFKLNNNEKYYADLYLIACLILNQFNISTFGGEHCSYSEKERFYSYRRDGQTGRMASLIWISSKGQLV